jgi:TolB-like protein
VIVLSPWFTEKQVLVIFVLVAQNELLRLILKFGFSIRSHMMKRFLLFFLCATLWAAEPAVPNVAVLDITGSFKDFSRKDLSAIAGRFETELAKTGKVQVLERRSMGLILQEQGFQQSGACNTSECQVQVGQLLGVDRIITGTLTKVDKLYTLNLKMVDVGSGQNILSHALDIRGSLEDVMRGGCLEMAQIFAGLKKPTDSNVVLTAEKGSVWPWIIGGVAVVGLGVGGVILYMNQDEGTTDEYDIQ